MKGGNIRFLDFLADQDGFIEVVQRAWDSSYCNYKMKNVWEKLRVDKHALKDFHAKSFSKSHCKVEDLRKKNLLQYKLCLICIMMKLCKLEKRIL